MDNARRQWGETPWRREGAAYSQGIAPATQVAIVGAGLTGASTAYHLARRGITTTVFEAGRVGDGASGRTGGLVLEGTAAGPLKDVSTCVSELQTLVAAAAIDCDLRLPGCWEIEHGDSAANPRLPWNDSGQPVHIARTVSGGVVHPVRLLEGILGAAARHGAQIRENAPVKRIVAKRPALEFAAQTIYPEYIVLAANAWLPGLLRSVVKIHSSLTFACATEPLDRAVLDAIGLGAGIPFYTADLPYLWGRRMEDGRVIFGAGLVFGSPAQLETSAINAGGSRAVITKLQQRIRQLHSKLNDVSFPASWGGPIAFTPNAVPLLGHHPSSARIIVAGAYSGHGVALSVRAGQLIARTIADGIPLPDWGSLNR